MTPSFPLSAVLLLAAPLSAEIPGGLVNELKPTIVNIQVSVQHGLNSESTGRHKGTGFIVDAERGIIATNRHVAGTSPGPIKIVFEDGRTAQAVHWYYDAWNDFAFIQLQDEEDRKGLRQVKLGDSWSLKEQDDVVMIGNNDAQEYSVKFGKTANLYLCKDRRHTGAIQTTFDRAGGSSGSPVFNAKGEVVAVHFAGTNTTSFEMRIEYLKNALEQLEDRGRVRRGDIGVDLDIMLISDAEKHFRLPESLAAKVGSLRDDIKRVAYIEQVIPRMPAAGKLQAGDIVLKVEGEWIGDDVYRFDRLVDGKVGGKVSITAARNGKEIRLRLPVQDAEKHKVRTFALFAGGVLHDVAPLQRNSYNISSDGVFLTQAEKGSSMADLGREGAHTKYLLLIQGVNGVPTPDLRSFIRAVRGLKHGEQIYMLVEDRWVTQSSTQARPVRLELKYFPLRVFDWSAEEKDWVEREKI